MTIRLSKVMLLDMDNAQQIDSRVPLGSSFIPSIALKKIWITFWGNE
jgi:hypothetical protein